MKDIYHNQKCDKKRIWKKKYKEYFIEKEFKSNGYDYKNIKNFTKNLNYGLIFKALNGDLFIFRKAQYG
jgi:arsenate reductase-like glutaredoxin family protein